MWKCKIIQQVTAINKDFHQKSAVLFKQDNLTLKQYKAGLLALEKDRKDKVAALLTPEQKDQLAQRNKQSEENVQVREAARVERLKLRLNLNDEQVAKLKAGQESLHNQAKAIHSNADLLLLEKREQLKALMAMRNEPVYAGFHGKLCLPDIFKKKAVYFSPKMAFFYLSG